jgi:hypothetical protein
MSRGSFNRTAVYLVTTPPEFRPDRPWTVPDSFMDATLFAKNQSVTDARHFVRTFNFKQVQLCQSGKWNHQWAIVSSCCRPSKWHEDDGQRPVVAKGGAT